MSIYHSIIRAPSITEKNSTLRNEKNKYVFEVAMRANKHQIRRAVEKIFNVQVKSINTLIVKGKEKRMGRTAGFRPDWKKAIVTLEQGQKIDKFGEV